MDDAVHRLVERVGGQIVEQQDGRAVAGEIVLEREDLAAVAQRALREQPDLRQAVEHDARRLDPLEGLEDCLGRLAEFQIGGIKQALLLVGVEQAFGGTSSKISISAVERPAMRCGARPQLALGFRQGDVEALLAEPRPSSRNCSAIVVLPVPGFPSSRNTWPGERPPARTVSRPDTPVRAFVAGAAVFIHRFLQFQV